MVVTAFPHAVHLINYTLIPLTDRTTLAARIWLPEDAEGRPVLAVLETHTGICRYGEPQDIAEPMAFLGSPAARRITRTNLVSMRTSRSI